MPILLPPAIPLAFENIFPELLETAGVKPETFPPANSAARQRTRGISSLTNPARPGQTIRVRDRVRESRFGLATPAGAIFLRTDGPVACRILRVHRSRYRNRRLCQTVPRCANSNRARNGKGKALCTGK